jgi:mannose-6-phosphate isomerase-like protein (cupin superfamily)
MAQNKIRANFYSPKLVKKGWGHEQWIVNTEKYCGKLLYIKAGKGCSVHFHVKKHETFYVHEGKLIMTLIHADGYKEDFVMEPGDCLEVTPGLIHRFKALGEDATIFEFSTQHFDEDSYRVEKGD